jgi:AhpD family alkylhydroperoxidase
MVSDDLSGSTDRVWRLPAELRRLRPEATDLLDVLNDLAWRSVSPLLLEQVRLRVAALVGHEAGLRRRSERAHEQGLSDAKIAQLGDYYASESFDQMEKDCLAFIEQFVIDVSGAEADGLAQYFPDDQLRDFVVAVYLTEFTQRLEMLSSALLHSSSAGAGPGPSVGRAGPRDSRVHHAKELYESLRTYQDAVMRGTALDPVVTELVRLRCARTHDCRICKALRLADARAAGADDAMTSKVDFYETSDLDERLKIALRITDAFITQPDLLSDPMIDQARSVYSQEELAELLLDITKWSTQKVHVALGTDSADRLAKNDQGVSYFSFDETGSVAGFSATPESAGRNASV